MATAEAPTFADNIKTLGDYPVRISLHPDDVATVTLHVVSA